MPRSSATNALIDAGRRAVGTRQLNHLARFQPVLDVIAETGLQGGELLDVGSGSCGLSTLATPGWATTALDADFEDYGAVRRPDPPGAGRVIGDVRALPFNDRSFDVAVAIDLLEHVPASDRALAIREICRVARRLAIIACPAGSDALEADRRLAQRLRSTPRGVPGWLVEHLDNGFPEPLDVVRTAEPFGPVRTFVNESIAAHERLILAENTLLPATALRLACRPIEAMIASRRPGARRFAARVLSTARGRDRPPTYRTVVVVDLPAPSEAGEDSS